MRYDHRDTGQPLERIERDTDRDYFRLSPQEAIDYGLISGVTGDPSDLSAPSPETLKTG